MSSGKGQDDHVAEFGMTGTTFTGASSTWMKALAIDSLGLPTKDESLEKVKLLIKNVTEIEDTTGECLLLSSRKRRREPAGSFSSFLVSSSELTRFALVLVLFFTGEFLLHLPGGKSVDTKSWSKGWEWTQG